MMNGDSWFEAGGTYKKSIRRIYGRECRQRLLYTDNYGTHHKDQKRWEETVGHRLRFFIKNATSKMQPIDSEFGRYCQTYIQREYTKLERGYTEQLRRTGQEPPKMDLPAARLWYMGVLADLAKELTENRESLVVHSWKCNGLTLPLDGSRDEEWETEQLSK